MWYAPLGFLISLCVGWLVSVLLAYFDLAGEPTIYTDENRDIINAALFTPPLAKRIQIRNNEFLKQNFSVKENGSSELPHITITSMLIDYYFLQTINGDAEPTNTRF